jgi:hypothetical protein
MRIVAFDVGIRNLSVCKLNLNLDEVSNKVSDEKEEEKKGDETTSANLLQHLEIEYWETIDTLTENDSKAKNCKHVLAETLIKFMIRCFSDRLILRDPVPDYVIIEQQPTRGMRMKALSYVIPAYYFTLNNPLIRVQFQSARAKLGVDIPGGSQLTAAEYSKAKSDKKGKKTLSYAQRKKLAVTLCQKAMTHMKQEENQVNKQYVKTFAASKKKDDYADSFLHGLAFLQSLEAKRKKTKPKAKKEKQPSANKRKKPTTATATKKEKEKEKEIEIEEDSSDTSSSDDSSTEDDSDSESQESESSDSSRFRKRRRGNK